MNVFSTQGNNLILQRDKELVIIEPWGPDCLRFRSAPGQQIQEENWNLLAPSHVTCNIDIGEKEATIINGNLSAAINDQGKVTFYTGGKKILEEQSEFAFNYRFREYWSLSKGKYRTRVVFKANLGEHFYGLGQEQNDCFDLKGSTSELIHKNAKSSIPFIYSSLGFGFLWNNPSIGRCELTHNHTLWESNVTQKIDYLVLGGNTPANVMKHYADITGYAPKFPQWASGFWQSKLRYEDQEELLEVAREYKKRNVPLSAIIIDYFHWPEQGDFKLDSTYWPNPEKMCEELEAMDVKPIVSIWPTMSQQSENYSVMDKRNMLITREDGGFGLFDFHGPQTYIDPTNKETREYVWSKIQENYYIKGIRNYWLDEAEPEIYPCHYFNMKMHLGNGEEVGLVYPYYYTKLFYEGLQSVGEKEIISLTRAAWIGSQRYGALVWSGDIPSTFDGLRMSVKTGLNMAMCGIPWWNSDIGGFWGADIESDYFKELIVRWFQFGIFCPVTRLHGARNKRVNQIPRNEGVKEPRGGDNEIWCFGDRNYDILKDLLLLREKLRPYIHKYMDMASENGTPVMRPMFFDYSTDELCYTLDDQYMFGEDILFAPIVNQGQTQRKVYLPEGEWVDVRTKEEVKGPIQVSRTAEIHEFIAFAKKDSSVLEIFAI
jgi:alpha-D-xyloside xylohydrolase